MGNYWDQKAAWPEFPPVPPVPEVLRPAFEKFFEKPATVLTEEERLYGAHMYLAAYFGVENAMTPHLVGDG